MKIEKFEKVVANLRDEKECVIYIKDLKQALNHGLVMKKVSLNSIKKSWLKPYTDMKIELRNNARNAFKKDFLKLINNAGFKKTYRECEKT